MIKLGLVGGAASYHGRAFAMLINGLPERKALPENWPHYDERVGDSRIVSVWDEKREDAAALAGTFDIPNVAVNMEDVAADVDGVIITDDGSLQHQRRARFFLEQGIPTYIDKPLSTDADEAASLLEVAAQNHTPVMSCSALRYAAETAALRAGTEDVGHIELATAVCSGELLYYGIHAFELAYGVLGPGIASVHNVGAEGRHIIKLTYRDGRVLLLLVSETTSYLFQLNLYGTAGHRSIEVRDAGGFYTNMLREVVRMVQTRQSPVPAEQTLEIIRVLVTARESLVEGRELSLG
jgi:predicted dehydrogenase